MSTALDSIKADLPALLSVLGLERAGNHCPCRFCGSSDGLSVQIGHCGAYFRCHSCDAKGDIIKAVALIDGITNGEAIRRLTGEAYRPTNLLNSVNLLKPIHAEPVPPVPDQDRVFKLMELALTTVLAGSADKWLAHRGIRREFIARSPILGFVIRAHVDGWRQPLTNTWVILIQDPDGVYRGVKFHRESPKSGPKSLWAPFGTRPSYEPRHGYSTFWPCPEWLPANEWLFLCPGELKAAAVLSAGRFATSITTGESFCWTPAQTARLADRRVFILFDDDEAGHRFRDNSLQALNGVAAELKVDTFGKENE